MVLIQGPKFDRCSLQNDCQAEPPATPLEAWVLRMSSTALFLTEAEVARRTIERRRAVTVATSLGDVRLRITGDIQSLEALWEQLQGSVPCTAAQTFDWAKAWERHVLGPGGREPVIVVGSAANGRILFLSAVRAGQTRGHQVALLARPGSRQLQSGACSRLTRRRSPPRDLYRLLGAVARDTGAAAAMLQAQPFSWDGSLKPDLPVCANSSRRAAATP